MNERKGYRPVKMTTHARDKELVLLALSGNQKAYNDLLAKYKPILYTAAKRRLTHKPVEDLEDIVMIVLGQAFVRINQYNPEKSLFFTWMVACLHNYINGIPGQKKRIQADSLEDLYPSNQDTEETKEYNIPDEDVFDLEMDRQQTFKLIRALVDKLPKESSDIIKLKYFKELSYGEIAEAMGIDETHVWYKLKKAKDQLKKIADDDLLF
jgi:RNA polymerase sigma factor (sigma-70 family)